jgi:Fe/S biogenesis protein NfuA
VITDDAVLSVSDEAIGLVLETRASESNAAALALYLEVSGEHDGVYTYDMWFEVAADAGPSDVLQRFGDLALVVTAASVERVRGASLELGPDGLGIANPNTPARPVGAAPAAPLSDLSSPIELAVLEILESEINPQIASHGGRADLVAVDEDGIAYVRLSGGCQGCGLAEVTLSQGIAVAIQDAVPEIAQVVDVTAHSDGTNPYFEAAKK